MRFGKALFAVLLAAALAGCAVQSAAPVAAGSGAWSPEAAMTKELQAAFTPDKAMQVLKEGNSRFTAGNMLRRDLPRQVKVTGYAQHPFASIVSCIDSRSAPETVFDLGVGDVFAARVAGNIVNEDILGSLEFASKLAGSKLVVVLGHTSCGAIKGACDDATMGNLTTLLAKIKPAVQSIPASGGDRSSKNAAFVEMVAEANVKRTVATIREKSPVLREMEQKGEIRIVGAMLDVKTGQVAWY
jgi:carbonic anhydrase